MGKNPSNASTDPGASGVRWFRLQLAVLIAGYTIVAYGGIFLLSRSILLDSLRSQAASYFDLVLTTRQWNAQHGGVWLLESEDVGVNPFLQELGIDPRMFTEDGAGIVLRNPSAMTREVSDLTRQGTGVSFHLVGREAVNPHNSPDDWESVGLGLVEAGEPYAETVDRVAAIPVYRYMEPLLVDPTCTGCHASTAGFVVGKQRGAVTVDIPMAQFDAQLSRLGGVLAGLTVLTLALGIGTSQLLVSQLQTRLTEASRQLQLAAVTDELTGIANRRATLARLAEEFERSRRSGDPLGVISLDLDHFKLVNDSHGHAVGDRVLREFVSRATASVRAYDVVGRVGGEEFLVIAPDADLEATSRLADRLLDSVRSSPLHADGAVLHLTASAGVAQASAADTDLDALLVRADAALYVAKNAGRDQISVAPSPTLESASDTATE